MGLFASSLGTDYIDVVKRQLLLFLTLNLKLKNNMKNIYFFPNGNTAVFIDDKQVGILQEAWIRLFFEHLIKNEQNPEDFEITMPDGSSAKAFKLEDGSYNWKFIKK